jgi:hypothetical protein
MCGHVSPGWLLLRNSAVLIQDRTSLLPNVRTSLCFDRHETNAVAPGPHLVWSSLLIHKQDTSIKSQSSRGFFKEPKCKSFFKASVVSHSRIVSFSCIFMANRCAFVLLELGLRAGATVIMFKMRTRLASTNWVIQAHNITRAPARRFISRPSKVSQDNQPGILLNLDV